jgi:hypothetical protein
MEVFIFQTPAADIRSLTTVSPKETMRYLRKNNASDVEVYLALFELQNQLKEAGKLAEKLETTIAEQILKATQKEAAAKEKKLDTLPGKDETRREIKERIKKEIKEQEKVKKNKSRK